jgi:hypothetical protein
MANPRYWALLLAASALPSVALHSSALYAQAQSNSSSYDDMAAAAKQAATQEPKKADPTPAATTPATTAPPVDPAAPQSAATPATPAEGTGTAEAPAVVAPAPKMERTLFGKMKPVKPVKEKPPKLVPVNIVHGELTVDGLIAKAGLNFQIADLKFFYIWVPGLGTAVVSNEPFPGAKIQVNALDGKVLTVDADGHQLQLACDQPLLNEKERKPKPVSMFVSVDRSFDKGSAYPEFGYGIVQKAPYNWPGTLVDLHPNGNAPTLPSNLRQKTETVKTCKKNDDGTQGDCKTVEVTLVLGKPGKTS